MLRNYYSEDIFTILLIISTLLILIVKQNHVTRFYYFVAVVWNNRYLKFYSKDRKLFDVFDNMLFLNFLIGIGIFIYLCFPTIFDSVSTQKIEILLYLIFGVSCLFVVKFLSNLILGLVFKISDIVWHYSFLQLTYTNYLGVVLIVINTIFVFSGISHAMSMHVGILLFSIVNLLVVLRFISIYRKLIIPNTFYFLLYLCILEIGPYTVFYKVFKEYIG